jgi:hypothetical protein
MSIEAWPFLVSRNRYLDYRTVVAPKFICEAGISNLLARVADGDLTQSGCAYIRRVQGSKAGDFSIIFQVVEATEKDINPEGENQVIKDQFGREIYLLEGILVKQFGDVNVTQEYLEKAHDMLVISYRQFWNWTAPRSAIPSEALLLGINGASLGLKLEELKPFQVVSKIPAPEQPRTNNTPPQPTSSTVISVVFLVAVTALLIAIGILFKVSLPLRVSQVAVPPTPRASQQPKDDIVVVYDQKAKTNHVYAQITGKLVSNGSDASGRYWIIGKDGSKFIITKDGKSIYKTDEQIHISKLITKVGELAST